MAIVSYVAGKSPLLLIGPMINQFVLGLRCAEKVIVKLLEIVDVLEGMGRIRFIVSTVKESLAIFGPSRAGRFDPLDLVRQIAGGIDLAHLPFLPVRAGGGQAISHQFPIVTNRVAA